MTADSFRKLALGFPDTVESAHQDHPDFRVKGKVFATLGYPDDAHGMVKLTPQQQAQVLRAEAEVFFPAAGAWGRSGCTCVVLKKAKVGALREVMKLAVEKI
jgi:hypothetical protein